MRTKWWTLILAVAAAALLAGCGSSKKSDTGTDTTPPKSAQNKKIKAPATQQPASAKRKPDLKTLAALPKAKKPGQGKTPQIKGLEGKSVDEKLQIFVADIGAFWQQHFSATQVQFQPATVYFVTAPQQIACNPPGTINPNDGLYYCPTDSSLSLPVQTLTSIDQDPALGDAGAAAIVAVGYGLHVGDVVGLGRTDLPMATCLGGVWTSSVYQRGLLDPGDLDKIATLVHGWEQSGGATANSLLDEFNKGYSSGDPGNCSATVNP